MPDARAFALRLAALLAGALAASPATANPLDALAEAGVTLRPFVHYDVERSGADAIDRTGVILERDRRRAMAGLGIDWTRRGEIGVEASVNLLRDWREDRSRIDVRRLRIATSVGGGLLADAGQDVVSWSFFDLLHPLDPVAVTDFRIDPLDPTENDGRPFARATWLSGAWSLQALASFEEGPFFEETPAEPVGALRLDWAGEILNLGAQVSVSDATGARLGVSGDVLVGDSTILAAEAEVATRRFIRGVASNPTGGTFDGQEDGAFLRAQFGARHTLSGVGQIDVGLMWNGHGYSSGEWDDYRAAVGAAQGAGLTGLGFIGDALTQSETRLLRRRYAQASFTTGDNLAPWTVTTGGTLSLDDGSTLAFADVGVEIAERATLRLSASTRLGPRGGEFGLRGADATVAATFTLEF